MGQKDLIELHTFHGNKHLLKALFENNIPFLVVGGLAVHYYCPERVVDDLDIFFKASPTNAKTLIRTVDKHEFGAAAHLEEALSAPGEKIKHLPLKTRTFYLDLIVPNENFDFKTEIDFSEPALLNNIPVKIVSRQLLIKLKIEAVNFVENTADQKKHQNDLTLLEVL